MEPEVRQRLRSLVEKAAGTYGLKVDEADPMLLVVDLCVQALEERLEGLAARQPPAPANGGREFAQAVAEAFASSVAPKVQATVQTEVARALATVTKPSVWSHPALVAGLAGLVGVIVGALITKIG